MWGAVPDKGGQKMNGEHDILDPQGARFLGDRLLLYSVQAQIHHTNLLCGKIVTQPNWTQEKTLKLLSEKINSLPFYPLCKTQIQFLYNVIQFPSKFSQSFIECVLYNPLVKRISSTLILISWALINIDSWALLRPNCMSCLQLKLHCLFTILNSWYLLDSNFMSSGLCCLPYKETCHNSLAERRGEKGGGGKGGK